jgi:hypothetical protein
MAQMCCLIWICTVHPCDSHIYGVKGSDIKVNPKRNSEKKITAQKLSEKGALMKNNRACSSRL